ncbi:NAD(P)/FAD-dependent oxidoreductase [Mangrovibacterium marinum]|uniref:Phytoene desaturase n=1 Tax=Mangrovibacterium marinum TaxID=1639118 RepID=A0A2T5BYR7_9BACT|nr:phytoene desaturase family protein [Mangrovibacterium marinum]PTN07381.1 phytoene desaturase [Mangrovibacterium marinum]
MTQKALIIGTGLAGLSTALRLSSKGYAVEMVEKYHRPGGRLNLLEKDGFKFDMAPTFFSMSYEFKELADYCGIPMPFEFVELDPLYAVHFEGDQRSYLIYKDLKKLAEEFKELEVGLEEKLRRFLKAAGEIFHDTEHIVIKQNFDSLLGYLLQLTRVPLKHAPKMFYSMWKEMERNFDSFEVKVIFSLVGFFLGSTPFDTPAVYAMLNYTELVHDGYHNVKGGMYKIVEGLVAELGKRRVQMHFGVEINRFEERNDRLSAFIDTTGKRWEADLFVVNADAAAFRGQVLGRKKFSPQKLDAQKWTLAPLTIYLGLNTKVKNMYHHNYFLRRNFEEYAHKIFKNSIKLDKPYYYVNIQSMHNPDYAPPGKESVFILCPVPDLRFKPNWDDAETIADAIVQDLSERTGFDFAAHTESRTVYDPQQWESLFNLYRGSGLGLAHDLNQVGGFRPSNKDEQLTNLYYAGASTVPGTGLPMTVISSRLVTERILNDHGTLS